MRFVRKILEVDATKLSVLMQVGDTYGEIGDYLVTFEDGSQCIYPAELFAAEFTSTTTPSRPAEVAEQDALPKTWTALTPPGEWSAPQPPSPGKPWIPAPETSTECTCIDCGQTVKKQDWDPSSGVGRCCIRVKCLSCGTATKMKDIAGQYCPSCLPALAGRDRG